MKSAPGGGRATCCSLRGGDGLRDCSGCLLPGVSGDQAVSMPQTGKLVLPENPSRIPVETKQVTSSVGHDDFTNLNNRRDARILQLRSPPFSPITNVDADCVSLDADEDVIVDFHIVSEFIASECSNSEGQSYVSLETLDMKSGAPSAASLVLSFTTERFLELGSEFLVPLRDRSRARISQYLPLCQIRLHWLQCMGPC